MQLRQRLVWFGKPESSWLSSVHRLVVWGSWSSRQSLLWT